MKRKIVWEVVSGWMVAALLLASCAPAVVEEPEEKVAPQVKEEVRKEVEVVAPKEVVAPEKGPEMALDSLGQLVKKPQYGGALNTFIKADPPRGWTRTTAYGRGHTFHLFVTNETLGWHDRLKGPAGTGEWSGMYDVLVPDALTGNLAESWELMKPDKMIFHIRKGVRWQNKPPVNGAPFTAGDVVYSYVLTWSMPGSVWPTSYPDLKDLKHPENSIYIHPDDPWAVVFEVAPGRFGPLFARLASYTSIVSKEMGDPKGEGPDWWTWKTWVGTGAFMLKDVVQGSSITWERNPGYWQKDAFFPENQLPYIDRVNTLIIPDASTVLAALRAGKIDIVPGISPEHREGLVKSNPELKFAKALGLFEAMQMREDVAPFGDVRVRRAMSMATNYDEIVNNYYGGQAVKFWWPAFPVPEFAAMYVPLEKMPESVQELFTYNPDKAKQLLAEAGYPEGFKTSITVPSDNDNAIDLLALVKFYWAKVGVDLEIDVKTNAVATSMQRKKTFPHGYYSEMFMTASMIYTNSSAGRPNNNAMINDPFLEATREAAAAVGYTDWAEHSRITREAAPRLIDAAHHVRMPIPYVYTGYQPWLGGYHGEISPNRKHDELGVARYVWIDQEMKKALGH